ncbi:uncharacterized protein PFL1_04092 [Pseudozyma flocculosa PF-1]|uniref:Uncharacterized protein n=2 Tax=Pseudozyma flocculosa TaxID=84751 RepID=A0A5C3EUM1_9BASI|nr:uncharacterized protein PFL1_04092 [Pseudozyma flocculosa PF-1]EPQ28265.1 hypothetical protein PFL1_04092 [Pseudozyma flocculosa PF-1]SPO35405.1 uncharacterized protein PSFLO_00876 [Pseudozyma flocculosa]
MACSFHWRRIFGFALVVLVVALSSSLEDRGVAVLASPVPEKITESAYPGGISVVNGSSIYCPPANNVGGASSAKSSIGTICHDLQASSSSSSAAAYTTPSLSLVVLGLAGTAMSFALADVHPAFF